MTKSQLEERAGRARVAQENLDACNKAYEEAQQQVQRTWEAVLNAKDAVACELKAIKRIIEDAEM